MRGAYAKIGDSGPKSVAALCYAFFLYSAQLKFSQFCKTKYKKVKKKVDLNG
jgi:hypothetical protein